MIHECGHFVAARKNKVLVEEFGFGLPPRLWGKKKGDTIYSLNWIPFGGFVKMLGEDGDDEKSAHDMRSFRCKSIGARMFIVLAGVAMNFILAWILITGLFIYGMKPLAVVPDELADYSSYILMKESVAKQAGLFVERKDLISRPGVPIMKVMTGKAAEKYGVEEGDIIKKVAGEVVSDSKAVAKIIKSNAGKNVIFEMWRGEKVLTLNIDIPTGGQIGVGLGVNGYFDLSKKIFKFPVWQAPIVALQEIINVGWGTLKVFATVLLQIFTRFEVSEQVSGPVGIFSITNQLVQSKSVMALIQLMAVLSISLSVINVFPFPALDGGRFVFLLYEAVMRKRPSEKFEGFVNAFGFIFLIGFLFFITFKDILRLF